MVETYKEMRYKLLLIVAMAPSGYSASVFYGACRKSRAPA